MNNTLCLSAIITTLSTPHAAEQLGSSSGNELISRMNAGVELSADHTPPLRASTCLIPVDLLPYAQQSDTSKSVRIYLTKALYQEHKAAADASNATIVLVPECELSLILAPQESQDSIGSTVRVDSSQPSADNTLLVGPGQDSPIQTEYSESLQHLTQSPNPSL